MAYAASIHQVEPYTQVPNYYLDTLKPNLSSTEADLCDVVIRMTYGWHRRTARISIGTFMAKTARSRRAIITAKSALVESGLLVLVEEGGGRRTSRYMLDLYYDRVEEVIHPVEELGVEDTVDTLTLVPEPEEVASQYPSDLTIQDAIPQPTSPPTPPISDDNTTTLDPTATTLDSTTAEDPPPVMECEDSVAISDTVSEPEVELPAEEGTPIPISDSTPPSEPVTTDDSMHSRGANSTPPLSKDLDLGIISINKHTETVTPTVATTSRENISDLHCMFSNLFPKTGGEVDYGFWGYLLRTYGLDRCSAKIRYMGEHRRHNHISNPQGFLRRALEQNYQPPKSILQKIKADEAAKVASERSRKEAVERRARIDEYDYEAATAALNKLMETLN